MIAICPECRDNKHGNCDSTAWHDELDELVTCGCFARDHKPEGAVNFETMDNDQFTRFVEGLR